MYHRKYDFQGYIDEAEVGENNSSTNVGQNKDGCCNKEEETENCHLQQKEGKWKDKHIKVESTILYVVSCLELHHTKTNHSQIKIRYIATQTNVLLSRTLT